MNPFASRFRVLKRLAKVALLAVPLLGLAVVFHSHPPLPQLFSVLAGLAAFPCLVYGYVLTILHWKGRYRGSHSDWKEARRLVRAALRRQPDSHWLLTRLSLAYY